jgi:hypothetical protein
MNAEGIPMGAGYIAPLYLGPIYHERKAPAFRHYTGTATYERGLCPVVERLHERDLVLTLVARAPARTDDMDDIVRAVEKIMAYPGELTQAA